MTTSRTSLLLTLALTLFTVGAVLGGPCAPAAADWSCLCQTEDGGDVSGDAAFASPEPEATVESTGRALVAMLDAAPAGARLDGPPALPDTSHRRDAVASSPPLYLSHCAFLC